MGAREPETLQTGPRPRRIHPMAVQGYGACPVEKGHSGASRDSLVRGRLGTMRTPKVQ